MKKLLLSCCLLSIGLVCNAKVLHSEKSLYRNITVEESADKRCMVFGRLSNNPDYQSCINPKKPEHLVFSYTKLVLAGLTLMPNPKSILIIGLGGGTLPLSLEKLYPKSLIETVEIDESVVRVAKQWFMYKETKRQLVHIADGRVFIKRQIRKQKKYDLVILDAFNGDYIPEHLMTEEFLQEVKALLTPRGLVIANTFSDNKLYDHESVTYQKVFGKFDFIHSQQSGNRIIYAQNEFDVNINLADKDRQQLDSIGVDLGLFRKLLTSEPDWQQDARPLTDQYSPANLLNQ